MSGQHDADIRPKKAEAVLSSERIRDRNGPGELFQGLNALPRRRRNVVALEHGRRDFLLRRLLALADGIGLTMALLVATQMASSRTDPAATLFWGALTLPLWVVLFKAYGLYDRDIKRVSHTTVDDIPWVFHGLAIGCVLLWVFYAVSPADKLLFSEILAFAAVAMVSILTLRWAVRRIAARTLGSERAVLLGDDIRVRTLLGKIRSHPEYGLEVVGIIDRPGASDRDSSVQDLSVLGQLEDLGEIVASHGVERLIISHVNVDEDLLLDALRRCKELSLKVSVIPQMFDVMGPSVEIDDIEGVTLLGINPPVLSRSSRFMKRSMDVAGAGLALALAAPFMLALALAIRLDSRGPVFFAQERIGQGGRRFRLYKFRTMVADAEQRHETLLSDSADPHWLHLSDDPRITPLGRLLRLASLDELPQLWNVLKGEMSLVGPRPLIESEDRHVEGWARSRLDLTPGITGSWQVLGRTNIPFDEMVKLDYLYVTNWSLWNDIRLILHTLPAVVMRRGAN